MTGSDWSLIREVNGSGENYEVIGGLIQARRQVGVGDNLIFRDNQAPSGEVTFANSLRIEVDSRGNVKGYRIEKNEDGRQVIMGVYAA
jgi:hypothetical protein